MIFTESAPLGRFSHRVAVSVRPSVRVSVCPWLCAIRCSFFLFVLNIKIKTNHVTSQNCIGPNIRIGRENQCLPYAGLKIFSYPGKVRLREYMFL